VSERATPPPYPFFVREPAAPSRVVVEIPHAGVALDEVSRRLTRAPERAIAADADVGADALWEAALDEGATLLVATASRYVVDLATEPRLPTPAEEKRPDALRAVRVLSASGDRWTEPPLPRAEIERRVREVHAPWHALVGARLAAARARHGVAALVSAHTYPDALFPAAADVVVGTLRGRTAPPDLVARVADAARAAGLSVALDAPFAGGLALARHAGPGTIAVQIEVARRVVVGRERAPELAALVRRVTRDLRDFG
jgi:N-formylglutamate amidohydrolase